MHKLVMSVNKPTVCNLPHRSPDVVAASVIRTVTNEGELCNVVYTYVHIYSMYIHRVAVGIRSRLR